MTHQDLIQKLFTSDVRSIAPLYGGDINSVYSIVDAKEQHFVVKVNLAKEFPMMLGKEANGIAALSGNGLNVPEVVASGELDELQYLVLKFIVEGSLSNSFWENFGAGLARLHQSYGTRFGFKEDNYIGSLVQTNTEHDSWADFLINERLIPQLKLASDKGILEGGERQMIEGFFNYVENLWPIEKPTLLHGDLWSGNFIVGKDEAPFLIDPAVYYGHREMDLGMMYLFGGFDPHLFEVYNTIHPLEQGWEERIAYNQLYPLLVHLNLFGRSYFGRIQGIVNQFS